MFAERFLNVFQEFVPHMLVISLLLSSECKDILKQRKILCFPSFLYDMKYNLEYLVYVGLHQGHCFFYFLTRIKSNKWNLQFAYVHFATYRSEFYDRFEQTVRCNT